MDEKKGQPESNIKSVIDAATGLVNAIPIYQDVVQPSAKEVGKSLETITKAVNIALSPIKGLVWGYERIEEFISKTVTQKLSKVPIEDITTPPPQVAGPTIEALRYSGHDEYLRDFFANLLATSMDATTIHKAHPGYVDIIKNISPDEAIMLLAFTERDMYPIVNIRSMFKGPNEGFEIIFSCFSHFHKIRPLNREDMMPSYLDNLCRLGILENTTAIYMTDPNTYEPLINDEELEDVKKEIESKDCIVDFERGVVRLTSFGTHFIDNVVKSK